MARVKMTVRKHVCVPPRTNFVPTESHSDGQNTGYFPTTLQTVVLALGYSEPPLFVGVPRLLRGNSYLWRVRVIIYEKATTDHIHRIRHMVEATTPRWTFERGMREATREDLALLWHEVKEQMEQSQYHHFLSRTREGAKAVVIPAGDHDHIGCFADQVKLTRCHTPFQERGNEASIHVPRMFKSHAWQQYDKQMQCYK
jgi:hypothetical protein